MELKFLGRGSAFNVKEGNTSAFIKEENRLVLIDCGSNIFDRIIKSNILDGVEQLLVMITHTHPDHIGSIGDLILYCHHIKNIIPVIYINRFAGHDFDKYMGYQNVDSKMYNIIDENNSLCNMILSIFKIYDFENIYTDHVRKYTEYTCEKQSYSSAFKFKYNDKTILYTGDTNKLPDGYKNSDEIYVDCTSLDYVNNPHYYISKLYLACNGFLDKIYCMHFDSDEAISIAKELGFNVVELYE
jgi:Cft2 family RNA processing exonuclease